VNKVAQNKLSAQGKSFRRRAKIALLGKAMTIEALARSLRPKRQRSTVSKAINQFPRFPLVRKQVERALGL